MTDFTPEPLPGAQSAARTEEDRIARLSIRYPPSAPQETLWLQYAPYCRSDCGVRTCNIPLGCARAKTVLQRIPVRFPDGREGVKIGSFSSVTKYTKEAPHPQALRVVGAEQNMDDRIEAGTSILYASSAIPDDIYESMPVVRTCCPNTVRRLTDARPSRKIPEKNFTFAHLLSNVACRQWTWCYNMVSLVEDPHGDDSRLYLLREALYIVAICAGWDEEKNRIVWCPELELRIPEAWIHF